MRTIEFRGKSLDNEAWEYGDLLQYDDGSVCIGVHSENYTDDGFSVGQYRHIAPVDENTVGQYTGLYDSSEEEIYDGDILKFVDNGNTFTSAVGWNNEVGAWCITFEYEVYVGVKPLGKWLCEYEMEIVGNIHDNPELIKGGVK